VSRLERATHIDFNGDRRIGRPHDVHYGYPAMYPSYGYPYGRPYSYTYAGYYY
jgi:hypothetical protein